MLQKNFNFILNLDNIIKAVLKLKIIVKMDKKNN